jgi:hypothetical protein
MPVAALPAADYSAGGHVYKLLATRSKSDGSRSSPRFRRPAASDRVAGSTFEMLIDELQRHWTLISNANPGVEDIRIIGMDLTRRGIDAKTAKAAKRASKVARGRAKLAKSASRRRERSPKIASLRHCSEWPA